MEYKKASLFRNKMNLEKTVTDQVHMVHCVQTGVSPLLYKIPETNEELSDFRQYYLLLRWELEKMEEILREKRMELESKCDHNWVRDWDNRDERSRWKCTKCTKFR